MILGFGIVRGSGNIETRDYDVKNFRCVKLSGIGNLFITQNGKESLQVEAEDNLFDYFRIEVSGDELRIGIENNTILRPKRPINFNLSVRDIEGIAVTGSGNVQTSGLRSDRMEIRVSGSGDLDTGVLEINRDLSARVTGSGHIELQSVKAEEAKLVMTGSGRGKVDDLYAKHTSLQVTGSGDLRLGDVQTESIQSKISGSGDIELSGKSVEQEVKISASGKYKAEDFQSENSTVRISGSGSVKVAVSEKLHARISGGGSIYYHGRPIIVQSISGSGKVKYIE